MLYLFPRPRLAVLAAVTLFAGLAAGDDEAVFRSDVNMGRIDAQVLDEDNLPIAGLGPKDFVLTADGKPIEIRDFSYEKMPVDVVLLLDVSGSMEPHVATVANTASSALRVLGSEDRVAIMTFNTGSRVRMPFKENHDQIARELDSIVRESNFGGGTDINGALIEAAEYIQKSARREARHAIIIVTDDEADHINSKRVAAALSEADAVLMALLAPQAWDAWNPRGRGPGRYPGGGGYPGGGQGGGWPDIIFGPGGGPLGRPRTGPQIPGAPPGTTVHRGEASAGTPEAAEESGGESLPVNRVRALEETFARIRQRYALHFYLPDGADPQTLALDLTEPARQHHTYAELTYRQVTLAGEDHRSFVKRVPSRPPLHPLPATSRAGSDEESHARLPRGAVSESHGPQVRIIPRKQSEPPPESSSIPEPDAESNTPRRPNVSEPSSGPMINTVPRP